MPTSIRSEQPADHAAIAAVQRAAFARDAEANLVSALRHDGLMLVSLVALHGEIIIGHVMFSTLRVEVSGRELVAATLAPLAVVPDFQRRGYGSALVRAGIAFCGSVDRTYRLSYLPAALCTIPMRGRAEGGGIGRSSISRRRCTAWRLAPAVKTQGICPPARARGVTISGFRNIAVRARQSATTRTTTRSPCTQSKSATRSRFASAR